MQQNFDMQQLMALARSPAGQQLFEVLKRTGSSDMEHAASLAKGGNLEGAKQALSGLLESEEIRKLLRQMEGSL